MLLTRKIESPCDKNVQKRHVRNTIFLFEVGYDFGVYLLTRYQFAEVHLRYITR